MRRGMPRHRPMVRKPALNILASQPPVARTVPMAGTDASRCWQWLAASVRSPSGSVIAAPRRAGIPCRFMLPRLNRQPYGAPQNHTHGGRHHDQQSSFVSHLFATRIVATDPVRRLKQLFRQHGPVNPVHGGDSMIRTAFVGLIWVFVFPLGVTVAAPVDPALARAVDAYIAPYVPIRAFSGVALIAKGDSVLLEKGWGFANEEFQVPNTSDTRFRIASITKRFTLIVVTRLAQEKKLALTD